MKFGSFVRFVRKVQWSNANETEAGGGLENRNFDIAPIDRRWWDAVDVRSHERSTVHTHWDEPGFYYREINKTVAESGQPSTPDWRNSSMIYEHYIYEIRTGKFFGFYGRYGHSPTYFRVSIPSYFSVPLKPY